MPIPRLGRVPIGSSEERRARLEPHGSRPGACALTTQARLDVCSNLIVLLFGLFAVPGGSLSSLVPGPRSRRRRPLRCRHPHHSRWTLRARTSPITLYRIIVSTHRFSISCPNLCNSRNCVRCTGMRHASPLLFQYPVHDGYHETDWRPLPSSRVVEPNLVSVAPLTSDVSYVPPVLVYCGVGVHGYRV